MHHCGETTDGFYLTTLSTVDVASGWSECMAVWGKGQDRVGGAIHKVRQRQPHSFGNTFSDHASPYRSTSPIVVSMLPKPMTASANLPPRAIVASVPRLMNDAART